MSEKKKVILLAVALLAAGAVICGICFAVPGFGLKSLSSTNYVTNEYAVSKAFHHISVQGDTETIDFVLSEDGKCKVVCCEDEKEPHNVRVEAETLSVDKKQSGKWHFGMNLGSPRITVYLPAEEYGTLSVKADTGNVSVPESFSFESIGISLETGNVDAGASAAGSVTIRTETGKIDLHDMSAGEISLSSGTGRTAAKNVTCRETFETVVNTGRTELSDVICGDLVSTGSTGGLKLSNVISSGEFRIKRSTGDIQIDGCDAEAIYVETSTGNVTGTILTDKVFLTESETGKVSVPKTITGGRCEITTSTGNISISVP